MKSIFYWFLLSVPCFSSIALAQEKDTSAVVISGGISLGVYEAGLNHVIVKTMNSEHKYLIPSKMDVKKLPKMNVTTGSSAGAINSIASAISSCIKYDKYSQTLFDNIFRDIWIGVGLDNLMPVDYSKYDGLSLGGVSANNEKQKIVDSIFSRTVFEEPIDKLRNMFETGQAKNIGSRHRWCISFSIRGAIRRRITLVVDRHFKSQVYPIAVTCRPNSI